MRKGLSAATTVAISEPWECMAGREWIRSNWRSASVGVNARLFSIVTAMLFAAADVALIFSVGRSLSKTVGFTEILSALGLQIGLVLFSWAWARYRRRDTTALLREPASYRVLVPVTPIGFLLLGAALSLSLLYVGLVCPGEGLPMIRGRGFCSKPDVQRHQHQPYL